MMNLKQIRKIVLNTPGATWEMTRNNHYTVRLHGRYVCTVEHRPDAPRTLLNTISRMRRAGIDIPRK